MPILAGRKRRERTNASSHTASIVYNAPGVYQPKYGKIKLFVSGHGSPGNNASLATIANYNPTVPGNYAGTNPSKPGNIVYNPTVPGNKAYNPPVGGTISGYNPPVAVIQYANAVINYSRGDPAGYDTYHYLNPSTGLTPYTVYQAHATNYLNPIGGYEYMVWTVSESPIPGNANYNPVTPGNVYYNPPTTGTIAYNPPVPGTAYYNPPTYVNAQYAPGYTIPGNYVAGNTNSPVQTPGNYVPATYVPGVTNPGNTNPGTYTPGNTNPVTYNPGTYTSGNYVPASTQDITIAPDATCPPGWADTWYYQADSAEVFHDCILTTNAYTNPGTYQPGNTLPGNTNPATYTPGYTNPATMNSSYYAPAYTNPATYQPGNSNPGYYNTVYVAPSYNPAHYTPGNVTYNATVPGTIVYNASTPGSAYYNPATPGNANYNPAGGGNPAQPFSSLGVTFPGGGAGTPAAVISDTVVTVLYSTDPIPVPVAPGGQVIIKESW